MMKGIKKGCLTWSAVMIGKNDSATRHPAGARLVFIVSAQSRSFDIFAAYIYLWLSENYQRFS